MQELRRRFHGRDVKLLAARVTPNGHIELRTARCPVGGDSLVRRVHGQPGAWFRDRALHVSA